MKNSLQCEESVCRVQPRSFVPRVDVAVGGNSQPRHATHSNVSLSALPRPSTNHASGFLPSNRVPWWPKFVANCFENLFTWWIIH